MRQHSVRRALSYAAAATLAMLSVLAAPATAGAAEPVGDSTESTASATTSAEVPAELRQAAAGGPVDVLLAVDSGAALRALDDVTRRRRPRSERLAAAATAARSHATGKVRALRGQSGVRTRRDFAQLPVQLVRVDSLAALESLAASPGVTSLALPKRRYADAVPSNLSLVQQPAAELAGHTGAGTRVAVLDTGINLPSTDTTFGDCNSGGGIGTAACRIKQYVDVVPGGGVADVNHRRHGTNVAGIVATVAPATDLAVYNVFTDFGGGDIGAWDRDILSALNLVAADATATNTRAVNLSLGDGTHYTSACTSSPYTSVFATLRAFGVVPVVAAGNSAYGSSGFRSGVSEPACVPGAVAVGAVYPQAYAGVAGFRGCSDASPPADRMSCFSQTGPLLSVVAPGVWIDAAGIVMSGTSQAAPHLAAAAAVVGAAKPAASISATTSALTCSGPAVTDSRTSPATVVHRLDLVAAVAAVDMAFAPSAPLAVHASAGSGSAAVSWAAGVCAGGSPVTGYTVTATPGGATCSAATTSCTVAGLANGTAHTFSVTATNATGTSTASAPSAAVTPFGPPSPALNVGAVAGTELATVSWTAGFDGGAPITSHRVTAAPGGASCVTSGVSCVVAGLPAGVAHTFTVTSTNAAGTSAASHPSAPVLPAAAVAAPVAPVVVVAPVAPAAPLPIAAPPARAVVAPAPVPGPPTAVGAQRGNRLAVVTWSRPAGKTPVTRYRVVASPGGRSCVTTALRCSVTGLVNGRQYRFSVTASNAAGTGGASVASLPAAPAAVPGTPIRVVATRANASVTVTWAAPAANGTAAVTGYQVTATPGGRSCITKALHCKVTGLVNGRSYTFVVRALNRVGASPPTSGVAAVPATAPSRVVRAVSASPAVRRTVVSWQPPARSGGQPVTRYELRFSTDSGRTWSRWNSVALSRSAAFDGWVTGRRYLTEVRAVSAAGSGPAVRVSVVPAR